MRLKDGLLVGCAALGLSAATVLSAQRRVWWQSKCCTVDGVSRPISCTNGHETWTCTNILISDPTVGTLSAADAGWDRLWAISLDTCAYYLAVCGSSPQLPCIYALPSVTKSCSDIAPPTTAPNCP
jgi:hypothetical protein